MAAGMSALCEDARFLLGLTCLAGLKLTGTGARAGARSGAGAGARSGSGAGGRA
jgi:hypothetical protein